LIQHEMEEGLFLLIHVFLKYIWASSCSHSRAWDCSYGPPSTSTLTI